MGKKRITQLLDQLQANHQADLQNAAAIFTVAQVAVNQLEQQDSSENVPIALLPPTTLDKDELKRQYGSHNACRNAAKQKGIRFKKTPTWEQLAIAFTYFESLQTLVDSYLTANPNPKLRGLSMEFKIE